MVRTNTREKHTSKSKQDTALVEDVYSKADDGDDFDTPKTDDESGSMPSFIALDSDSNQSTPDDSTLKKTSSLHFGKCYQFDFFVEDGGICNV